jgi:hypothetical protein
MHAAWLSWGRCVTPPQKGQEVTTGFGFPLLVPQGRSHPLQEYLHELDRCAQREHRFQACFER